MSSDDDRWARAYDRAEKLTAAKLGPEGDGRADWDHHGVRAMLAITLYAVSLRDDLDASEVTLSRLLVPLLDRDEFQAQAATLTTAGHDLNRSAECADPVVQQWHWLHRTWDPSVPPATRWDGMTRGIARGLPDPAIDVLHGWARSAITTPLAQERNAFPHRTTVTITAGPHRGGVGRVEGHDYDRDPTDPHDLAPGPPPRYAINLGADHGYHTELIAAEHLSPID
ncbi:hypothetical protein ACIP5Y_07585 [Nocardia sp. NPDC088792]|uniref:hypothetical protein n=1 Tax=Nocardia sp. NPDC088792 TaxID=3364332 RepID=UPI00381E54A0